MVVMANSTMAPVWAMPCDAVPCRRSVMRKVSVVKAAKGNDSAQNGIPKGCAAMRLAKVPTHNNTNKPTPHTAVTTGKGAAS